MRALVATCPGSNRDIYLVNTAYVSLDCPPFNLGEEMVPRSKMQFIGLTRRMTRLKFTRS